MKKRKLVKLIKELERDVSDLCQLLGEDGDASPHAILTSLNDLNGRVWDLEMREMI